jgi:hypothetical protein
MNELCTRCVERGRALASVSVHFFGPVRRGFKGRYERPEAHGVVEMNGVRIPLGELGNFAYVPREQSKIAIESYATRLDNDYAGLLRSKPPLKAYANHTLEAKVQRLVGRRLSNNGDRLRVFGLKLMTGSAPELRRKAR